jgi:hypothetical protein
VDIKVNSQDRPPLLVGERVLGRHAPVLESFQHINNVAPKPLGHASGHRRRHLQRLQDAHEIVVEEVKPYSRANRFVLSTGCVRFVQFR